MKIRRNLFGRVGVSNYSRTREKKREEETKLRRGGERERERKKEKIVDFIDRE